jgi:hypothetical protein
MIEPGLCGTCEYVKRTETKRGSVFYMCLLANGDSTLQKYPPLPVRRCHGYRPACRPQNSQELSP